jgi:ABC-2 type transport system permease protein
MDELIAPFGVHFVPGQLVNPGGNFQPDFIIAKPTREAAAIAYVYEEMFNRKGVVTMPSSVGLEYTTGKGFDIVPLFVSDSASWNELETKDFIDDTVKLNPAVGEVQQSYPTGLAITRKVGKKMQKIMILGDADCISNGEISISRPGVYARNYSVITGAFYWMSDNEVPIDVRRPSSKDDEIALDKDGLSRTKTILTWAVPGLLLLVALVLWVRRRGR